MNTYWISFVKGDNEDEKNVGVCIVDAANKKAAVKKATALGINPGGEAMLWKLDPLSEATIEEINKWGKNRLISPEDLKNDNYVKLKDLNNEEMSFVQNNSSISKVCEHQNIENLTNKN